MARFPFGQHPQEHQMLLGQPASGRPSEGPGLSWWTDHPGSFPPSTQKGKNTPETSQVYLAGSPGEMGWKSALLQLQASREKEDLASFGASDGTWAGLLPVALLPTTLALGMPLTTLASIPDTAVASSARRTRQPPGSWEAWQA